MSQHYLYESDADDEHELPSLETFYMTEADLIDVALLDDDGEPMQAGWYWWSCSPGCLPDGDPIGPFDSEDDALADAREDFEEFADEEEREAT